MRSPVKFGLVCCHERDGRCEGGVFVGHDHDDDYAVSWKGILLAYGRYTGGNTVYNHLTNGARVIELDENANSFRTWIRLKEGSYNR